MIIQRTSLITSVLRRRIWNYPGKRKSQSKSIKTNRKIIIKRNCSPAITINKMHLTNSLKTVRTSSSISTASPTTKNSKFRSRKNQLSPQPNRRNSRVLRTLTLWILQLQKISLPLLISSMKIRWARSNRVQLTTLRRIQ